MKKKTAPKEKNSLKTVFIFILAVSTLILISLTIKTILMIRASKYDANHHFTVALEKQGYVVGLVGFDPSNISTAVIQIKDPNDLSSDSIGRKIATIPDASIDLPENISVDINTTTGMNTILWDFTQVKTQLTFYDVLRLYLFAKSVTLANKRSETLTATDPANTIDKIITTQLSDNSISQENISIQIINASGAPGMANRLARVITNLGGNVVSVITSQTTTTHSHIQYYKNPTYTLKKISQLLKYPTSTIDTEAIADIVITIGTDSSETKLY